MSAFVRHQSALFSAYFAGLYEEALKVAREAHTEHPLDHGHTWYWQGCLNSLLGRPAAALDALRAGLDEGSWFNPGVMDDDPDLDAVRGLPGFTAIRDECARRLEAKRGTTKPECLVMAPATTLWEPKTLVALHQRGQSARTFSEHWRPLVDEGWTVVVPQSSQPCDSGTYCWDDDATARAEVRQHLDDCVRRRGISAESFVIAGASQGARVALECGLEAGVPWLCAIPGFPSGFDVAAFGGAAPAAYGSGSGRCAFILGERDGHNARTKPVIDSLASSGWAVKQHVMPGVAHVLPEGFIAAASEALRWLTGETDVISRM
jgi:predicted esterase